MFVQVEAVEEIEPEVIAQPHRVAAGKKMPIAAENPAHESIFVFDEQGVQSRSKADALAGARQLERLQSFGKKRFPFRNAQHPVEAVPVGRNDSAGNSLLKTRLLGSWPNPVRSCLVRRGLHL